MIEWKNNFSVGIDSIDEQHKGLIKMINDLVEARQSEKPREYVIDIVERLSQYTVEHFGYEEELFAKYSVPDREAHIKEHAGFVEKVTAFQNDLKAGKADLSMELLMFLSKWLIDHIIGVDSQYSEFLVDHGEV